MSALPVTPLTFPPPQHPATGARPFIKCAGGKTKLLPELLARVPERFGAYHEPFVGGGALFFALRAREIDAFLKSPAGATVGRQYNLNDLNADLVNAYREIRNAPEDLIRRLRGMKNTEKVFKAVRALNLEDADPNLPGIRSARACRFIFLNKTCFNGLHRVNRRGEFNVPFGHYANPMICDAENIRAVSAALHNTSITSKGFAQASAVVDTCDLVYFDPPYLPLSETSNFTGYTEQGFGWAKHVELAEWARELVKRGAHVLLSNSNHPRIRKLYKDLGGFKVEKVLARRNVNAHGDKRGEIAELLITGGGL